MFDNMSIIVLTQINRIFVNFFGIGSVSSYFLCLRPYAKEMNKKFLSYFASLIVIICCSYDTINYYLSETFCIHCLVYFK